MSKNINHIQHVKSNVVLEGKPKLPQAESLVDGELAINYASGVETISIKNASGDIVTFSSDNYYTEQKLGSGFTGENSANTVTSVIEENERIISSALNDLEEKKLDVSAYTEVWLSGTGLNSIVQKGTNCTASGTMAIAEGNTTTASGDLSHSEGNRTTASGTSSHAEGGGTRAIGVQSHAEGGGTTASGESSHAEGNVTNANGANSHAEGVGTTAIGANSHSEGAGSTASGNTSHAEGSGTRANGAQSHTEGSGTYGNGVNSHAEGGGTTANGAQSHAEGGGTTANGAQSHAEGGGTTANGVNSHAEGSSTETKNDSEHASGQYNVSSSASTTFGDSGNTLFSVGNGTASNARHNAFEIRQNGDIYIVSGSSDIKLQDYLGNASITVDQVIDSGTSASTNAVSTSAVYGFITAYTPSISVDQVIDETTSASTNAVSTKAVVDKIVEDERVWAIALNQLNNEKFGYASFDENEKSINFYKDSAHTESAITTVDLSDFAPDMDDYYTKNEVDDRDLWVSGTGVNSIVQKGTDCVASGSCAIAEGSGTTAGGDYSHAEGYESKSIGGYSHAEGYISLALGGDSHAEGLGTSAMTAADHSEGGYTLAGGGYSHAEGFNTTSTGNSSHAEGLGTSAMTAADHSEGGYTLAGGGYSHAEGISAKSVSEAAHAEGYDTLASGRESHSEGYQTKAIGSYSHAEGLSSIASGHTSHAEGKNTLAFGSYTHAEGEATSATGYYAHAEGYNTLASGSYTHAEGSYTKATFDFAHAEGYKTIARNKSEHASGQFNVSSYATATVFGHSGNTLFSVGNGTDDNTRHNAFEIRQNGDIYIVNKEGNNVRLQDEIGNITIDQTIDSGTSASTNAVSTSAVYDFVTAYTPSITVDEVLDDSISASTNPIASKAVYSALTDNELVWANAFSVISGTVSAHTANTEIHVTAGDKSSWNAKADSNHTHEASGVTAMTGYEIAASSASVLTTDSLLQAIGKLEKRIALLEAALGGMTLVKLTSQEYNDLQVKDPNTMYIIND